LKTRIDELAIFGGVSAFREKLHVGRPNIGNRKRLFERINDVLDRRWLTNDGPLLQEFENRIAKMIGVRHCIAVCNGTLALEIAIRALGLKGEVILPSMTFIATAHALQWHGIKPVFCDIDPRTHNLDPGQVQQRITPSSTAILGVHLWGRPCDVESLKEIAQRHNLKLLFDAAHAFACSHNGRMIGNFGDAEIFSFHATKFFNTFEGGAVVTNDSDLANKIRLMRNFGFAGYDNVVDIGTNAKMTEISAAMGLTSLESLDEFVAVNRSNYKSYQSWLSDLLGVALLKYDETEKCNYQYIVIEVDEEVARIGRDQLGMVLLAENVLTRRYFYPGCHRMEPYRSIYPNAGQSLSQTERMADRVLCLPTGTAIGTEEIRKICNIISLVIKNAEYVREGLKELSPLATDQLVRRVTTRADPVTKSDSFGKFQNVKER
jgi:dTDP-4-amino-4,6-dideoxygalactose transaminase